MFDYGRDNRKKIHILNFVRKGYKNMGSKKELKYELSVMNIPFIYVN